MEDFLVIPFKKKVVKLTFKEFEDSIDIDKITSIDYSNLHAELLTIPTLMNRIGLWKADADNLYAREKNELELKMDELAIIFRKQPKETQNAKGDVVMKSKTNDEIASEVATDKGVIIMKSNLLNRKRDADYLDSLYWAIKAKQQMLNNIGEKMNLVPEEFEKEITTQTWNGILIQSAKRTFQQ